MPDQNSRSDDYAPAGNAAVQEQDGPAKHHEGHADDGNAPPPTRKPWHRRPLLVGILIIVAIGIVVGSVLWWRHSRTYVTTDDAFVDIASQHVSPQIAGRVLRVLVNDNEDVAAGQVLVELDPTDFQNRLEQARASLAQAEAQLAEAEAQRSMVDAQREQARAGEGMAQANATNAAHDLQRFQQLSAADGGAVSRQQLDHASAEASGTAAQLQAAQKAVAAADAQLSHAAKQIDAARAAVKSAAIQVAQAELTLSYAHVAASVAGRVARKTVATGNYVQPGADLMAVVPRTVYVTANFKETQLTHLRRGQPVTVKIDSYPELKISGRVDSIQPATGQAFDLLPSQNAAGNWVKVVQRVPVKIVLDQIPNDPEHRLAPGMSAEVKVTVR
jgi:membrane fusion protein, multidrug efflux system